MIKDIKRNQFLLKPSSFVEFPRMAFAAVASDNVTESDALEGWNLLKTFLHGAGSRIGYRTFLALLEDNDEFLRNTANKLSAHTSVDTAWHYVAAPITTSNNALNILKEVEWRAQKNNQNQEPPSLIIIGVNDAL